MNKGNGVGTRERLTRDRICEAALEAIDEAGLESVSMRALAKSLGIKASSLYYHFRGKEELMTGIAEYLYRKLGQPPTGGGWEDQVRGTFIQLQEFIQEHPNAAPLLLRDLARSPVARKRARVLLGILQRAGLDPVASASLVGNLVALLVGHSLLGLYLQAEAGSAAVDETGTGTATRSMRPWIPHLFQVGAMGTVQLERIAPGEERPDTKYGVPDEPALELSESPASPVGSHSFSTTELAGDAVFLAGLDALLKGFADSGPA
ncbi:MAG: hypothetical protein A2W26_06795 [Acidobacteria bacterium RBG_16_64_8]|nr:MAG: hypothetical protein A2W26_06795 [Acidobacteria bacterium RBG_16_64_8]